MSNELHRDNRFQEIWFNPIFWMALLIAIPLLAGALIIYWNAVQLPETRGSLAKGQLWQAAIFATGLAVGLVGSVIVLAARSRRARAFGTSGLLLGIAGIALAYLMGWSVERPSGDPYVSLPFVIPAILAFTAMVVTLNALRAAEPEPEPSDDEVSEERQLPLSRP